MSLGKNRPPTDSTFSSQLSSFTAPTSRRTRRCRMMFVWPGGFRRRRNSEWISAETCGSCKSLQASTRFLNYCINLSATSLNHRHFWICKLLCGKQMLDPLCCITWLVCILWIVSKKTQELMFGLRVKSAWLDMSLLFPLVWCMDLFRVFMHKTVQ